MTENKFRASFLFVVVMLITVIGIGLRSERTEAAPFECTTGFYQIIAGQLKILDPETGTYANVGPADASSPNAAGYNVEDDHIYAMGTFSGDVHLIRYEHDGTFTDLGLPTGLPDQAYIAGDFDDSGNLWVREFAATNTIWRIDVSAGTATSLTLSGSIFISEMVHVDGSLYGLNGPALTRINLDTGVVSTQNVSELVGDVPAFGAFGAGWRTGDERLYFSRNSNGIIYEITDYEVGGTSAATAVLQGEIPTSNDGASCPNATTPIADLAAQDQSGTTVQDSVLEVSATEGLLSDATGYDVMLDSYTQPTNGTVVVENDGSYVYTPNAGYIGEDSFTYTITDGFGNTSTATVNITVTPVVAGSDEGEADDEATLADTGVSAYLVLTAATFLLVVAIVIIISQHRRTYYYSVK